jgi:hypothetical protein
MRELPGKHPPVIVVSGTKPDPADLPGVQGIVPKPFDLALRVLRVDTAAHGIAGNVH